MTVSELIAKLQEMPQDLQVFGDDPNGMGPVRIKRVEAQEISLSVYSPDGDYKGQAVIKAVVLEAI